MRVWGRDCSLLVGLVWWFFNALFKFWLCKARKDPSSSLFFRIQSKQLYLRLRFISKDRWKKGSVHTQK